METKKEELEKDAIKATAIMHAIEVSSSFKLYSYRIISHEQYIQRITELVGIFTHQISKAKHQEIIDDLELEPDGQFKIKS